jgi:hypothetical protein
LRKQTTPTHTNGYAAIDDLLAADDLQSCDLLVNGWKVAGVAAKIRVRGLTLPEREAAQLGAWKDGRQDEQLLVAGYLRYGVVVPTLNEAQAEQLARKHAGTVTYVARFIMDLTNLDYDLIQAVARALADADGATLSHEDEPATP